MEKELILKIINRMIWYKWVKGIIIITYNKDKIMNRNNMIVI